MDWNTLLNKVVDLIGPAISKLATSLLSVDFILIVVATIGATHILKLLIKYQVKDPSKAAIWLALTPLSALLFAALTWNGSDRFDWVIVGFAASPIANLLFWLFMVATSKYAPAVATKVQDPLNKDPVTPDGSR